MVQEDTGRFGGASRGKTGIIYVPADLVKDTTFPLMEIHCSFELKEKD
jgi:hypothetical protein